VPVWFAVTLLSAFLLLAVLDCNFTNRLEVLEVLSLLVAYVYPYTIPYVLYIVNALEGFSYVTFVNNVIHKKKYVEA
jgi:hypothetical protein